MAGYSYPRKQAFRRRKSYPIWPGFGHILAAHSGGTLTIGTRPWWTGWTAGAWLAHTGSLLVTTGLQTLDICEYVLIRH